VVWEIRDRAAAEMEHDGVLSRNFARLKLVKALEQNADDPGRRVLDVAFVDESQDLSAADLRALKLMTARGLLMAGDAGQSIYGISSPYPRAALDIAGRSRVLRTSFRNTRPIQELADAYRSLTGIEEDDGTGAKAFREGPMPELHTAASRDELARLLLRRAALFMDALGYDPENITVLAPTRTDIATLGDLFGHAGYRHANIRDDDFSFAEPGTVRLSTLHSSKGLDFPVVLLYLPELPPRGEVEQKAGLARVRNLIYVAMTRAMDNLNVFTLEGAHEGQNEEPLQGLVRVMRTQQAAATR
jgi:ATP-dependent exoDNAse (exonuclease V) beta subunit